jgi:protein SCO1
MAYLAPKTVSMLRIVLVVSLCILMGCSDEKTIETQKDNVAQNIILPYYNSPDFMPLFFDSASEAAITITHTIADFQLTDQEGKTISQKDIEGKVHVADFFFTTCGSICPKMTTQMTRVQKAFENDTNIVLLSYSVTPWIDSISQLQLFAKAYNVNGNQWHLLTGHKSTIYDLARKSYFAEQELGYTKDSTEFLHTEHFILVDKTKRIRGIYNGTLPLEIDQLIEDMKLLEKE